MAYSGATAASSVSNPPVNLVRILGGLGSATGMSTAIPGNTQGGGIWYYSSTNATTDIVAANFFTDGKYLGMKPGDMVQGNQYTSAGSSFVTFLGSIVSVSTSGAALSTGSLMTSTFG